LAAGPRSTTMHPAWYLGHIGDPIFVWCLV
jgi:hypothetical protein